MSDFMLDLETLGNGSNSVIIAVGAVKFDPKERRITDRFYSRVDPQSCVDVGMVMDVSTILWWFQQSEAARAEFKGALPKIGIVLQGFTSWINKMPGEMGHQKVWGNGATFDNVILSNAYKALKMERPWKYNHDRCYRTLKALYPDVPMPTDTGLTSHRADHDAEFQAIHLMSIWPRLR